MAFSSNSFQLRTVLILLSLALLLIGGCASVGKDFSGDQVTQIRIGKTTQEEIRAMFGAPWRVGLEDGQRTWTYGRYRMGLFGSKAAKDLTVRFDQQGAVASYSYSTTEHDQ